MRLRAPSSLVLPLVALLVLFGGCSPDDPLPVDRSSIRFDGSWSGDEFVLERLEQTTPGGLVRIELVGTNLQVDTSGDMLSIDVAIRNRSGRDLFAPIAVFLGRFLPEDVLLTNGDEQVIDPLPGTVWPYPHLFDYSGQLGPDGFLGADETSEPRTWEFSVPDLKPFSFASEVQVGLDPTHPFIGGTVFTDLDRDGVYDDDEPGFGAGSVTVVGPSGPSWFGRVGEDGTWRFPAGAPGLYTVTYTPPPFAAASSPLPFCLTTPNPLQVVMTPGVDGVVQSYWTADFGVDPDPCFPPVNTGVVRLVNGPPDSIQTDPFWLVSAEVVVADPVDSSLEPLELLELTIGFSGCGPQHPAWLFAGAEFMESEPVRTWLRVKYDSLGEECDAVFEQSYSFDLAPLRHHYRELYGGTGTIILELATPDGQVKELILP